MRNSIVALLAVLAIAMGLIVGQTLRRDRQDPGGTAESGGLTAVQAAQALRESSGFTVREGSTIGRELVEVLYVRRIGQTSMEVEFTWRDSSGQNGQEAPLRTSMALFRSPEPGRWVLTSLYKVD